MKQSLNEAWERLYHNLIINQRRTFDDVPEQFKNGVKTLLDKDTEKEERDS